jgi:hypothetical protein
MCYILCMISAMYCYVAPSVFGGGGGGGCGAPKKKKLGWFLCIHFGQFWHIVFQPMVF